MERFSRLAEVHRCVQAASAPSGSAADVARVIFPEARGPPGDRSRELTHISVSLVGKIASGVTARRLQPEVASYFVEVLKTLFDDMGLMSHLVHYFQDEDQILSHLAAKSVSACVLYLLHQSGAVCPVWKQKCLQAFHSSAPSSELDACLWSLTEVLKRLLKGAHPELFGKLLGAFDSSLSALCSKYLPEEETEATPHLMDHSCHRHWGTTLCLLMDLMEVLTASSLVCGARVCLQSQKLTHVHSWALLKVIGSSSECYVKKRALLLLKRAALQKAGEDWSLGDVPLTESTHEHPDTDMTMLSRSVLTAVAADWLESVQVGSASFFGGTKHGDDNLRRPDSVMLRAVSLLLLKSMELHIQSPGGTGPESAAEMQGCLQNLWGFLRRNSVQLKEATHLCCWVSLLFGEQDDDMMEAAKALLSIFLHHRQRSDLDAAAVLEAACASGCNPHCHFLVLLQSISFDHSILLDFLISTETCFLEYFVRYLRFLRTDWQGFTAACGRIDSSDCHLQKPCGDASMVTRKDERRRVALCAKTTHDLPTVGMNSSAARFRLVEYTSSDESDQDITDSPGGPGKSVCDKTTSSSWDVKQEIRGPPGQPNSESSYSTEIPSQARTTVERRPERLSPAVLKSEQTSCPVMPTLSEHVTNKASVRAVGCLAELREVVTRLQVKKLFPYNPSSLLKLLTQVENCSQHSHLSHPINE